MRISPFIASLMERNNKKDPLRKQFIPSINEVKTLDRKNLFKDVNADDKYSPITGLVHRYPTKVLVMPTDYCGSYCRYCFRRKFVGQKETSLPLQNYKQITDYIKKHKKINEVILSGGDPLVLNDSKIDYILKTFSNINGVRILRIHTRIPVTIPF